MASKRKKADTGAAWWTPARRARYTRSMKKRSQQRAKAIAAAARRVEKLHKATLAFGARVAAALAKTQTGHIRRHHSAATRRKIARAMKRRHRATNGN